MNAEQLIKWYEETAEVLSYYKSDDAEEVVDFYLSQNPELPEGFNRENLVDSVVEFVK
jgi:hypothetical protein